MNTNTRTQLKGAFAHCKWCYGSGCLGCDEERRKCEERRSQPIFTADRSDPKDMDALKRVFGREALEHAFGPDGEGMAEIERNAALESVLQSLRKSRPQSASKTEEASHG